jgi:hypothetical protein
VGLVVVVKVSVLVTAAAVGQVSAAGRLESIIPAQCLANVDFGQRVSADLSGFTAPSIAVGDASNHLVPAVRRCDKTVLRDLEFTLAKNSCGGWLKRDSGQKRDGAETSEACLQGSAHEGFLPDNGHIHL